MSGTVKHRFVSGFPDGDDAAQLRPSNWNDSHVFDGGTDGSLMLRDIGNEDGFSWLSDVALGSVLISGGDSAPPTFSATPSLTTLTLETTYGISAPAVLAVPPTLMLTGDLVNNAFIEVHNRHAFGADFYVHNDPGYKAPYINLYKSRGTQSAPTALTLTGYELDSMGGINFGGYDGTVFFQSAAILSQNDENWSTGHHGGHLSVYGRSPGGVNMNQLIQFGGLDPTDLNAHNSGGIASNIISYLPIVFNGNTASNVGLFPTAGASPKLSIKNATNAAYAELLMGTLTSTSPTTADQIILGGSLPIETHSIFANGITCYTHSDTSFRAPSVNMLRSRGTQGIPTAAAAAQQLGYLNFGGYDGSAYAAQAQVVSFATQAWAVGAHGASLAFNVTANGATALSQAMVILGSCNVGFGTTISNPTAVVHIRSGSSAAGTAPLKFTTGVLLGTPEAGAFEYNTDNLHFTIATGAARKGVMFDDGARLTSGKIPVATTNGRLIDGPTPLAGTKTYWVSDSSGGAVTRKLTFTNGILTAEV